LALEGHRFYDVVRWRRGELFKETWQGMYVPALNTAYDLNSDGKNDVAFVTSNPANPETGVMYVNVASTVNGQTNNMILEYGNSFNLIEMRTIPRIREDRMYLYPITQNDYIMNTSLRQKANW